MPSTPDPLDLERHARFVRAIARRLTRDEHTADDVVQDTWVAAHATPPRATGGPARTSWLGRVARHLALRAGRTRERVQEREEAVARPEAVASPLEILSRESALRSVTDAVLALDEPYRDTILSSFYEGLDARAIAARDGVALATVRSRRTLALAHLRERLDRECGGERGVWSATLSILADSPPPLAAIPASPSQTGPATQAAPPLALGVLTVTTATKLIAVAATLAVAAALWTRSSAEPARGADVPLADARVARPSPPALDDEGADARQIATPGLAAQALPGLTGLTGPLGLPGTSADAGRAAVEVSVVYPGGAPAAGRVVELVPERPAGRGGVRRLRSDALGKVLFEGLEPGHLDVQADLGGGVELEVGAGERAEARLELPRGLRVRGRVVDLDGVGVADAEVLLSESRLGDGFVVARTDAGGAFDLSPVEHWREISARHPRLGPSARFNLSDARQSGELEAEVEVVLELVGRAAALTGVVRDPQGLPIAGAWLLAQGYARGQVWDWRDRVSLGAYADAAGVFRLAGLPVGSIELAVCGAGWAPTLQTVEVVEGDNVLDLALEAQATVAGIVRDLRGEPLANVQVGLAGYDSSRPRTRTDAAGRYRLGGLSSGAVDLVARYDLGQVQERLQLASGEVFEWDPVLGEGRVLRGRVVDGGGRGLPGWSLHARTRSATGRVTGLSAGTDEDGAFLMMGVPSEPFGVEVYSAEENYQRVLRLPDVVAGEPLEIVIGPEHMPSARVSGRVQWSDGTPLFGQVLASGPWGGRYYDLDALSGGFDLGPFSPGPYEMTLAHASLGDVHLADFELAPAESLDLGTISFAPPAALSISVEGELGRIAPFERFMVLYRPDHGGPVYWRSIHDWGEGTAGDSVALLPGRYLFWAEAPSKGLADRRIPFDVEAGQELTLDIAPAPGVPVLFRWVLPEGVEEPAVYYPELEVDGESLFVFAHGPRSVLTYRLPYGLARISVRSDTGLEGEVLHAVSAGDAPPQGERWIEVSVSLH